MILIKQMNVIKAAKKFTYVCRKTSGPSSGQVGPKNNMGHFIYGLILLLWDKVFFSPFIISYICAFKKWDFSVMSVRIGLAII